MARLFPNELICDFAETYHVLDWRTLPVGLAATLAAGLRDSSRVKMKIAGAKAPADTLLLAAGADALKVLVWQNTRDGAKGKNPPESILQQILSNGEPETKTEGFAEPSDFMAWRNSMLRGDNYG